MVPLINVIVSCTNLTSLSYTLWGQNPLKKDSVVTAVPYIGPLLLWVIWDNPNSLISILQTNLYVLRDFIMYSKIDLTDKDTSIESLATKISVHANFPVVIYKTVVISYWRPQAPCPKSSPSVVGVLILFHRFYSYIFHYFY